MSDSKVAIVHLRRPNQKDKKEMRSDPFYEFGSFGCTGCHRRNLMNPKKIEQLNGVRLAFSQGGPEGFKLIQLTLPIKSVKYKNCCELKWDMGAKFFKYKNAPLLINNKGNTHFPCLLDMLRTVNRSTWVAKFSSKFRAKREQLPNVVALEMIKKYSAVVKSSPEEHFADNYAETMHTPPPKPDKNRKETYQNSIKKANSAKSCKCKQKSN
jgi:hypothetical protein